LLLTPVHYASLPRSWLYAGTLLLLLQIDAIKAAALERQAQLDRETAELKQQQDDLTAKLKDFQQRVGSFRYAGQHALLVQQQQ
jgi:hypothetical protein